MSRKKVNQNWMPLLCVLAAVLVLLVVVALVLGSNKKPSPPEETTGAVNWSSEHTNPPTEQSPSEDLVIQTPYCDLVYPGQWRENLAVEQVSGTEHDVNFYAAFAGVDRIHLFSITFSPDTDGAMAVIKDKSGNNAGVYLHISDVTVTLSDAQMNEIYSMQEMANDLLDQLIK